MANTTKTTTVNKKKPADTTRRSPKQMANTTKTTTVNKKKPAKKKTAKKFPYVIVRAQKAGVHAGELVSMVGGKVHLRNSRRIWYWTGAATLSELAVYGSKTPGTCKFPPVVPDLLIIIGDVGEVIYCQPAGEKMIRECPEWRA